ncbi:alpha/beta hydrolase [Saccharopolyspora shandongensis]|uniref:alpha/beta fold hydrolase n=1 Tax=Saccharopolyspora shandongensis TaxID=418495 RepID=UPI0033C7A014
MRLHTRTWGDGEPLAVLVHGLMSDSRTWHRVAPRLVERGYRVIAVDLRGHGESDRGPYTPQTWADDLAETVAPGADVVIGHSLGAAAVALAVDRLEPGRAVYCDPAWLVDGEFDMSIFKQFKSATREQITQFSPRWDAEDVDVELATLKDWDPDTVDGVGLIAAADTAPRDPGVPSLVVLAGDSPFCSDAAAHRMRERGLEVRVVPGVGHTLHRDDLNAFLESLKGWI